MERRLQDSLYLIVKRNRSDNSWQFPQGKWLEEENMRQTAERVIDRAIGKSKRWFMSNAPVGHYCYEYPQAIQEKRNNFGAKVFYYRAQVLSGSIKLQTKLYTDYAWVAR
jgi:large subunit ribosomal protein L46